MGKTTIVTNLGASLAGLGKRVLLIDCDAQGNLQNQFNVRTEKSLAHFLMHGEVDVVTVRPNLDMINSGKQQLADTEIVLAGNGFSESILKERLKPLQGYDYIFCDLSPTITLTNTLALSFCDYLLIPVSMSFYAITGAHQILETAKRMDSYSPIYLLGLILNFYDDRTNMSKMVTQAVCEKWGDKVFRTFIRKNVALQEAPCERKTIFEHAPRSHGTEDFRNFTEEFLEKMNLVPGA